MRSGKCPKCGSEEVHEGSQVYFKRGSYGTNSIPITFFYTVPLDNYVCVDCGYVESYVAKEASRRRIAEVWPRTLP